MHHGGFVAQRSALTHPSPSNLTIQGQPGTQPGTWEPVRLLRLPIFCPLRSTLCLRHPSYAWPIAAAYAVRLQLGFDTYCIESDQYGHLR